MDLREDWKLVVRKISMESWQVIEQNINNGIDFSIIASSIFLSIFSYCYQAEEFKEFTEEKYSENLEDFVLMMRKVHESVKLANMEKS
jgi:hypothetical protein